MKKKSIYSNQDLNVQDTDEVMYMIYKIIYNT